MESSFNNFADRGTFADDVQYTVVLRKLHDNFHRPFDYVFLSNNAKSGKPFENYIYYIFYPFKGLSITQKEVGNWVHKQMRWYL